MKQLSFFFISIIIISSCKKEDAPKDFRENLVGTYRITQDSTVGYECIEYQAPPNFTCLKRGIVKTYQQGTPFDFILSYDESTEDIISGTAKMNANLPWDGAIVDAKSLDNSLIFDNSNYYNTSNYTIKIKGDSIFYSTYYASKMQPEYSRTYSSGVKIK
jgi:hypothetical protein